MVSLKLLMKSALYGTALTVMMGFFASDVHAQNRLLPIDGCEVMPGLTAEDVEQGIDLIPPLLRTSIIGGEVDCRWEKQIGGTIYRAYYETRMFGITPVVVVTNARARVLTSSIYIGPDAIVDFDRPQAMIRSPAAECFLPGDAAGANRLVCSQFWDKYVDMVVNVPTEGPPRQFLRTSDDLTISSVEIRGGDATVRLLPNYDPTIIQVGKNFESLGNDARPVILAALQSGNAELVKTSEDGNVTVETLDMTTPRMSFNILNQVSRAMALAADQ